MPIFPHSDFSHTDFKDLKDGYAASGYAVMVATRLAVRNPNGNVR